MWTTILCVLGWSHLKLNRRWRWLAWANESVYPWYVLHQTVIIVLVSWLAPLALRPWIEAPLVVVGTVLGCWGITALVRRSDWLRPLFGLKRRGTVEPADAAGLRLRPHPQPTGTQEAR
jgi:peptidoglycan/LPS O-acetylase OafA/YrhL